MKATLKTILVLLFPLCGYSQQLSEILGRPTNSSITVSAMFDSQVEVYFEYGTTKGSYSNVTATNAVAADSPVDIAITGLIPNQRYYYRTRYRKTGTSTYLASSEHTFVTQRKSGRAFRFTVESDPHPYDKKGCWPLWDIALQNQLNDTADFMIDMGDTFGDDHNPYTITNDQVKQLQLNCRGFFGKVCHSMPFYFCIGNHEGEGGYYLLQTPPNNLATYETNWRKQYFPNPSPDGFYTGNSAEEGFGMGNPENYFAWEWGDALFVVLDVYRYATANDKPQKWDWTIGKTQYDWLKQTLETSNAKYKFVFAHHILGQGRGGVELAKSFEWGGYDAGTYKFDTYRSGWGEPIHQLMQKNGVNIFFQGHDHIYVKQELDGIVYQTVPMPSDSSYKIGITDNGDAFTSGTQLGGSGHIRVTVASTGVTVDYVSALLPKDETTTSKNGAVVNSYTVTSSTTGADEQLENSELAQLNQNYSNPFVGETTIGYRLQKASRVQLKLFDLLGKEIATLVDQYQEPGDYNLPINAKSFSLNSGIYFYRISVGSFSKTMKMICVKQN